MFFHDNGRDGMHLDRYIYDSVIANCVSENNVGHGFIICQYDNI